MTLRPGSTIEAVPGRQLAHRRQQPVEGAGRVVEAPGVDRDRQALLLDVGARGVGAPQQARELALEGGQALRGSGRDDPAVAGGPALVAVLAEEEQLLAVLADRVTDLVEPAQRQRLPGRSSGDDGDRADHVAQPDQDLGRVRVDVGLARLVDDRREHTVEVEADHDLVGGRHDGVVALAAPRAR